MASVRQDEPVRRNRPWWRPLTYSAAVAAAIAALFQPLPASADPQAPAAPPPGSAVPDRGSLPIALGTLVMPGQTATAIPAAPVATPGVPTTPLLQKLQRQHDEVSKLGDQLIRLGEARDLAKQQVATAAQKVSDTQAALLRAKQDAAAAAAAALREQAALPPGTLGSGLADLDALSRMQRGDSATEAAAARQLALLQAALTAATAEQATATASATDLSARYDQLNAEIAKKQQALQKVEQQHAGEIRAAEAAESAADRALGRQYLAGARDGRGADRRAIAALKFALAQLGDPYVWSEEGPDQYDCSGLMYAAYRSSAAGSFALQRVARDQYSQTHQNPVDRYSLLPGDLLFFSSSNSWQDIHHVAMYAGRGMMVEAPRSGLTVRVVQVRWTRLFGATRVYGSVEGVTQGPDLTTNPPSTTRPPATSTPPTKPSTKPPTTKPTTPSTTPSTKPTTPSTEPTTPTNPSTNPNPSSSGGSSSTPAGNGSSSSTSSSSTTTSTATSSPASTATSSSAAAAESASSSAPAASASESTPPS